MQLAYKRARKRINARREAQAQDRIRLGFERGLTRKFINYFSSLSKGASKALTETGTMGFDVYMAETRPKVARILEPHWYDVIKTFSDRAENYILRKELYNGFYQELLEKFIMRVGANHISDIDDTSRKQLRRVLLNGQKDGLPLPQIARNIEDRYSPKFSRSRSATRARTETHSAASFANHQVGLHYARTQPDIKKQWIASNDDRTREAHRIANGQIVSMDEPFIVGGRAMEYTGDPNGGAANIINCRCAVIYIEPDTDVYDDRPPPITPPPLPNPAPIIDKPPLNVASLASVVSVRRKSGELRGKTDKEIADMYDKKLKSELTPTTEKVFNNTPLPKLVTAEGTKGYYRPSENKVVSTLSGKTLTHEYGHHIDYATSKSKVPFTAWSESNEEFINAFRLDKRNLPLTDDKLSGWKSLLFTTEKGTKISKRGSTIHFTRQVPKNEGYGNVSDIIDALSNGKFYTNFYAHGHGKSYYRRAGAKEKETFANLFALQNDKQSMDILRKIIPNTVKVFDERMAELAN